MFWKKKKLTYDILISELAKPFDSLNEFETQKFFDWYISNIAERTAYLINVISSQGRDMQNKMDFSPELLIVLWDWFLNVSEIEDTPQRKIDEIKKQLKGKSKEYIHMVLNDSKNQFTLQTEYIIRDMAMYFGEVIVKNNETLKWGYHTNIKKDSFANMPSIQFNTDTAKERGIFGKYIVFQKVGNAPWCNDKVFSIIQVYDRLFDSISVRGEIEGIRILPLIDSSVRELKGRETKVDYIKYFNRYLKACMIYQKKHHYPKEFFYFIGNQPVSEVDYHHTQYREATWEKEDLDE